MTLIDAIWFKDAQCEGLVFISINLTILLQSFGSCQDVCFFCARTIISLLYQFLKGRVLFAGRS
jgi:hypothetical protein